MTFQRVGSLVCDAPGCTARVFADEPRGWWVMPGRPGVDYSVKKRKDYCAEHSERVK